MKKVQYRKNRKGFTLAELLITVAITVILASFGFVSVSGYQRRLKLTEMDNTAREIFIAAQNHLTSSEASGSWKTVSGKTYSSDDLVSVNASELAGGNSNHTYWAILSEKGTEPSNSDLSELWNEILPYGSITESVRTEGQYIVVFDSTAASIYGVLYTDNSSNAFGSADLGFAFDLTKLSDYLDLVKKAQNARISYKSGNGNVYIGWYGGAVSQDDGGNGSVASAPTVYFDNAEILKLNFSYSGSDYSYAVLKFTGKTSGAEVTVDVKNPESTENISVHSGSSGSDIAKNLSNYGFLANTYHIGTESASFSISLDDVTDQKRTFENLFVPDNSDSPTKFVPGEDITVTAYAVLSDGTRTLSSSATANSLFESADKKLISISNARHLQNLDNSVSGIADAASSARLTRDITWKDEKGSFIEKVSELRGDNSSSTADITFCSIYNNFLTEFEGNQHKLIGFSFSAGHGENAGLFAESPNTGNGFKVSNVVIQNASAASGSDDSKKGNVGILLGDSTNNLKVSNIQLTGTINAQSDSSSAGGLIGAVTGGSSVNIHDIDITGTSSVTVSSGGSGSAGGLIGDISSGISTTIGSIDFSGALILTVSSGENGSAGGLIGKTDAATSLSVSEVSIGEKINDTSNNSQSVLSVSGGNNAGGLIGTVAAGTGKSTTISGIDLSLSDYASISSNGVSGGLIGSLTSEVTAEVTISDCNFISRTAKGTSSVPDQVTGKYAAGGFIGTISEGNSGKVTAAISDSFSDTYVALNGSSAGASAGGFIGSISCSDGSVTIQRAYAAGRTNGQGKYDSDSYASNEQGRFNVYSPLNETYAGGFIGSSTAGSLTIQSSFSAASVYSDGDNSFSGGFIAALNGIDFTTVIKNSYSSGKVMGTGKLGAFIGADNQRSLAGSGCYALRGDDYNESIDLISEKSSGSDFSSVIAFAESDTDGSPFVVSSKATANPNDGSLENSRYPFKTSSQLSGDSYSLNNRDNQYFGDWEVPDPIVEDERLTINNGNVLSAEIVFDPEFTPWRYWSDEWLQVVIYGETSKETVTLNFYMNNFWGDVYYSIDDGRELYPVSLNSRYPVRYDSNTNKLTIILDDITGSNGNRRFAELFPNFSPGENLEIKSVYGSFSSSSSDSITATTNSIFADGSFMGENNNIALIGNARHLENLSYDVSLYLNATNGMVRPVNAKQIDDIDVSDFFKDSSTSNYVYYDPSNSGTKRTKENCLVGIVNDDLISYDGGEHKISNLNINSSRYEDNGWHRYHWVQSRTDEDWIGLFACLHEMNSSRTFSVKNLTLVNPNITGGNSSVAGALIGQVNANNNVTISKVFIKPEENFQTTISGSSAAGIVGSAEKASITIEDSSVDGSNVSISGQNNSGGLVGTSNGSTIKITGSKVSGDNLSISSSQGSSGGFAGSLKDGTFTVNGSYVKGSNLSISGSTNAGGLAGISDGSSITIADSYVTGEQLRITGQNNAGGLIGSANGSSTFSISNSLATAYVFQSAESASGSAYYAGGLVGSLSWTGKPATISNSYAGGHTSKGNDRNYLDSIDTDTAGRVNVYSANGTGGGLIGYQTGSVSIESSFSAASVGSGVSDGTSTGYSAGLIGYSTGDSSSYSVLITNSYSAGKVFDKVKVPNTVSDEYIGNAVSSDILNAYLSDPEGDWDKYLSFRNVYFVPSGSSVQIMTWNSASASETDSEKPSPTSYEGLKGLVKADTEEETGSSVQKTVSYYSSLSENDQSYPYPIYTTVSTTDSDETLRTYYGDWTETDNTSSAKVNFFIIEEDESDFFNDEEASSSPETSAIASASPETTATPEPSASTEATSTPTASSSAEATSSPSASPSVTPEASPAASATASATPSASENTKAAASPSASAGGGTATPYLHAVKLSHPLLKEEETEETSEPSSTADASESSEEVKGVKTEPGDIVTEEDNGVTIQRTVDIGKTISLSLIHPAEEGYTLVGWRLVDSEEDQENTGKESLAVMDGSGNTGVVHYDYDPDAVVTVEGDMNLKAVFVSNDLLSFANTWTSSVSAVYNPYPGNTNNCTWTAWQLVYEVLGIRLPAWGDAGYWLIRAKEAGFTVSSEPAVNSIVVFSNHVGFVSDVSEDGQYVYIKEGNYSGMYHEGWWPAYGDRHGQKRYGYIWLSGEGTSDISEEEIAEMENEQAVREQAEAEQKEAEETVVIADGYYVGNNEVAFLQDLVSNGLSVGTRSEAYSNTAPAGTILSHDSGTFEKGAAVNYTVSLGQQVVSEETAEPSESPVSSAESTPSASVSVITAVSSASSIPSVSPEASPSAPVPSVSEITPEASVVPSVIPEASSSASASSIPEVTTEPSAPVPSVTEIVPEAPIFPSMIPEASAVSTAVPSVSAEASVVPSASAGSDE